LDLIQEILTRSKIYKGNDAATSRTQHHWLVFVERLRRYFGAIRSYFGAMRNGDRELLAALPRNSVSRTPELAAA
jgi:hypothetical protein